MARYRSIGALGIAAALFAVYAVDSAGNRSGSSNTVSFTTPADTTPHSPAPVLSVTTLTPTSAVLTWPQPVDDFSTQVYWTFFVNGSVLGYSDRLGPPTQTLLNLTPETTYVFQVSVRDHDGNAVTGPPLVVTTPAKTDEQAPTAPMGLRADTRDGLDLQLFWNASTDDTDPQSEIRYDVYVDGARPGRPGHEDDRVVRIGGPGRDLRDGGGHVRQRVGSGDTVIFDERNP